MRLDALACVNVRCLKQNNCVLEKYSLNLTLIPENEGLILYRTAAVSRLSVLFEEYNWLYVEITQLLTLKIYAFKSPVSFVWHISIGFGLKLNAALKFSPSFK